MDVHDAELFPQAGRKKAGTDIMVIFRRPGCLRETQLAFRHFLAEVLVLSAINFRFCFSRTIACFEGNECDDRHTNERSCPGAHGVSPVPIPVGSGSGCRTPLGQPTEISYGFCQTFGERSLRLAAQDVAGKGDVGATLLLVIGGKPENYRRAGAGKFHDAPARTPRWLSRCGCPS
jgi:hypothetical protein